MAVSAALATALIATEAAGQAAIAAPSATPIAVDIAICPTSFHVKSPSIASETMEDTRLTPPPITAPITTFQNSPLRVFWTS